MPDLIGEYDPNPGSVANLLGSGSSTPGSVPSVIGGGGSPTPGDVPEFIPDVPAPVPGDAPNLIEVPDFAPGEPPEFEPLPPVPFAPSGVDANTKADKSITISGAGLVTGGGNLSISRTLTVTEASQLEAEAGVASMVVLTPRRGKQLIDAWWTANGSSKANATVTISGGGLVTGGGNLSANRTLTVTEASQAEAEAATASNVVLTPRRGLTLLQAWWNALSTIAGLRTFSTSPRSTGTPDSDLSILNRKQVRVDPYAFNRPLESVLRIRSDFFIKGSTTSGDIGEWGWSSTVGAGGSVAYGSTHAFTTGRTLHLTTGSTINTTVEVYKAIGSTGERTSNGSFFLAFPFTGATSPLTNCAVWAGWKNTGGNHVMAGWDTSVGPNFMIRAKGSYDASETVIDTGIAISTINPLYWPGQLVIDILGNILNDTLNGVNQHKVTIFSAVSSIDILQRAQSSIPGITQIDGTRAFVSITNRSAANKEIEFIGLEVVHSSGLSASQH